MITSPVQLTDVIYNAANQTFEASVTIYDAGLAHRYACDIDAPISMSFDDAAHGLTVKARRLHAKKAGLRSTAERPAGTKAKPAFDLSAWLKELTQRPGPLAA